MEAMRRPRRRNLKTRSLGFLHLIAVKRPRRRNLKTRSLGFLHVMLIAYLIFQDK
jgi:hypothetical protein